MKKIMILSISLFVGAFTASALHAQSFRGAMKVVERPARKTDEVKKEKAPAPQPTPQPTPQVPRREVQHAEPSAASVQSPHPDFQVKLVSCNRVGDVALVKFTIKNTGRDIPLSLYPYKGEAFDNVGNTYRVYCQLKDRVADYAITQLLPTDVPVSFTFRVDGLDASATELMRLQIGCDAEGKALLNNNILFRSLNMKK